MSNPERRHRGATPVLLERLQRGPATGYQLATLIYGTTDKDALKRLGHLIRDLRRAGHRVAYDDDGYTLLASDCEPPPPKQRTPAYAVYTALTTRGKQPCDCGAGRPVTHVALFHSLNAEGNYRYINALAICSVCAADFTDAEQILTMEDAYELAGIPVPSSDRPSSAGGAPAAQSGESTPRTDRPTHGRRRPRSPERHRQPTGGLPWFAGGRDART